MIFIKKIHHYLSTWRLTIPLMRFLSFLKNDFARPKFEDRLIKKMIRNWQKMKILDLGCGPCYKEQDKRFKKIDITCVDIFKPYLKICRQLGFKTLRADIRKIEKYFPADSVDIVWLVDVLEHLGKKEGWQLIEKIKKIARKQVIIWVPVGKVKQDAYDNNPYQKHLSCWYEDDFAKRGFRCEILKSYYKKDNIFHDGLWAIYYR